MGADINATCTEGRDRGQSILWLAVSDRKWKLVSKLIRIGADINATHKRPVIGSKIGTALGIAQRYNNVRKYNLQHNIMNIKLFFIYWCFLCTCALNILYILVLLSYQKKIK